MRLFVWACVVAARPRRAVVPVAVNTWPMPVNYYVNVSSFGADATAAVESVLKATAAIETAASGITFKRHLSPSGVTIQGNPELCLRLIGHQPVNEILLSPACARSPGVVLHELMHTLGFRHEQDHPNRSLFLTVSPDISLYTEDW